MVFDEPYRPYALTIICGSAVPDTSSWRLPPDTAPCYQALLPGVASHATLPYFFLGSAAPLSPEQQPPLQPEDEANLAEVLHDMLWLVLVHDASPTSMSLACRISAYAREHGIEVTTVETHSSFNSVAWQAALRQSTQFTCVCPADLDPLLAAQTLLASVLCQGIIGVDYADYRCALTGRGRCLWAPLPDDAMERLPDMLASLSPFFAVQGLWAVAVLPSTCGLDDFTKIGEVINQYCSAEATVIVCLPNIDTLPNGLYLFTC